MFHGMNRTDSINYTGLYMFADFLNRVDRGFQIPDIIKRIKNAENIDTILS